MKYRKSSVTKKQKKMKTFRMTIAIKEGDRELEKELNLEANDIDQLSEKLNALKILNQSVRHDDLMSTVEMINEKPELIPVVKKMIDEGEQLSESQLLMRLPNYVKQVLKVLKS